MGLRSESTWLDGYAMAVCHSHITVTSLREPRPVTAKAFFIHSPTGLQVKLGAILIINQVTHHPHALGSEMRAKTVRPQLPDA